MRVILLVLIVVISLELVKRASIIHINVLLTNNILYHILSCHFKFHPEYPNHVYSNLPNHVHVYLFPQGENLNLASDETDVNVTIGTKHCNVTSLALTQLVCNPPESQPSPTDETGRPSDSGLPLVVVRVGTNMRFPIGRLRYEMMKVSSFEEVMKGSWLMR